MKNKYEIRDNIVVIFMNDTTHGEMETIVSISKLATILAFPNAWYPVFSKNTKSFYAAGNITSSRCNRKIIHLSRWLFGNPKGKIIDHINHDTLNNSDENLREVTNAENSQNRKGATSRSASGIRGVYWHKPSKKWSVQLRVNGVKMIFGHFIDIKEAELVAIEARRKHMPFSKEIGA